MPVDLEDMVYTFEPLPAAAAPTGPLPARGRARPRRAAGRRHARAHLRDAPRSRRAPDRARQGGGFEPRGVLACGGAAVQARRAHAVADAGAHRRRGRRDRHRPRAHRRRRRHQRQGGVQPQHRARRQAGHRGDRAATGSCRSTTPSARSTATASSRRTAEPRARPTRGRRSTRSSIAELAPFARDLRQTLAACRARTGFTPIAALARRRRRAPARHRVVPHRAARHPDVAADRRRRRRARRPAPRRRGRGHACRSTPPR